MITKNQASLDPILTMSIAQRFTSLREMDRLSQTEWGELFGISQDKVHRIEKGQSKIDSTLMQLMLRKKSISIDWLLTGEGARHVGIEKNSLMTDVNLMREEIAVLRAMVKHNNKVVEMLHKKIHGQSADMIGAK